MSRKGRKEWNKIEKEQDNYEKENHIYYDDGCHDFFDVDSILIRRRYVI